MRAAERFMVTGPLPIPLYRWGPAWAPWGGATTTKTTTTSTSSAGKEAFLVSSPLTTPPLYIGPPLNRWVEAVYDFPLVYHLPWGGAATQGKSSQVLTSSGGAAPASRVAAHHDLHDSAGGAGVLVRGTPFALHSLPVPSSAAHHRAIRADLASRLPCPSSVWVGGFPGPRGLAFCTNGTVEGTVAGSEWVLPTGADIPSTVSFVFSRPSGYVPARQGMALVSVEQLDRLFNSDSGQPTPDLRVHVVPDGLISAAEFSTVVDQLRPFLRREADGLSVQEENPKALMLQHDLADSVEPVLRALQSTASILRSKLVAEPGGGGGGGWEGISDHIEDAHDAILQASLGMHWVQASWSPARCTRNQFLPLGRPSLLALQFAMRLLDKQLFAALDQGDYDLAAVLTREISFLKQSFLHSRAFVGLAAF